MLKIYTNGFHSCFSADDLNDLWTKLLAIIKATERTEAMVLKPLLPAKTRFRVCDPQCGEMANKTSFSLYRQSGALTLDETHIGKTMCAYNLDRISSNWSNSTILSTAGWAPVARTVQESMAAGLIKDMAKEYKKRDWKGVSKKQKQLCKNLADEW